MTADILTLLEEVQAVARTGLNLSSSPYERERCERLLQVVAEYYGRALDMPPAEARERLGRELGYITPKVGAHAAIFDPEGRLLLVQRTDDGRWCLPCGWVEPNESPQEAAVRETREETGIEVRPLRLIGVYTRRAHSGHGPHSAVAVGYLCEVAGGSPRPTHEVQALQYWRIEDVPDWHELHHEYALAARAAATARTA